MPEGRRESENSEVEQGKQIQWQEDMSEKWRIPDRISMIVVVCMQSHGMFHLIKKVEKTSQWYLQGGCMCIGTKEECLIGKTVTHSSRNQKHTASRTWTCTAQCVLRLGQKNYFGFIHLSLYQNTFYYLNNVEVQEREFTMKNFLEKMS